MDKSWKSIIKITGMMLLIVMASMFVYTFLSAYISQKYAITVFINRAGEATWELIVILASIPLIIYSLYSWLGAELQNAKVKEK